MIIKIIIICSIATVAISASKSVDYCDKSLLCDFANGPHIKCNNSGKFAKSCPENAYIIKLNKNDRMQIIKAHNKYRNLIASGKLPGYKPAKRMGQMCWCHDLAAMAELNVKSCVFEHDDCHSTMTYRYSGQNLEHWWGNYEPSNIKKILIDGVTNWFNEYKQANMSYIDNYRKSKEKIGHFTAMVAEKNRCTGCAAAKFSKDGVTEILFACNYATTNFLGRPIYASGKTASDCKDGKSKRYPALCTPKEKYF